jgi:predicted nucleic acid-binding Zn ribbon protein
VRRLAPRPLKAALEAVAGSAAPAGLLPRAQRLWGQVAGEAVAAESEPISEREGVLTVRCGSAVWAQELELLAPDIKARLNEALASEGEVRELRFTVQGSRRRGRAVRDP